MVSTASIPVLVISGILAFLGVVGAVASAILLVAYGRSKDLRSLLSPTIVAVIVSDFVLGLSYILHGSLNIGVTVAQPQFTELQCVAIDALFLFGVHYEMYATLFLALDRLVIVALPVMYNRYKYAIYIFCTVPPVVLALAVNIAALVLASPTTIKVYYLVPGKWPRALHSAL